MNRHESRLGVLAGLVAVGMTRSALAAPVDAAYPAASVELKLQDGPVHEAVLWQGFRHEWNGHGVAHRVTAHRISKFASEVAATEPGRDNGAVAGRVRVGQERHGHFGEWMEPEIRVAAVRDPSIGFQAAVLEVHASDHLGSDPPQARIEVRRKIAIDLTRAQVALGNLNEFTADVLLNGLYLDTRCDEVSQPARAAGDPTEPRCEQPPEESGVWPARWDVSVGECALIAETQAPRVECEFTATFVRATLPDGDRNPGFRPSIKYPAVMHYDVRVRLLAVVGPSDRLHLTRHSFDARRGLVTAAGPVEVQLAGAPQLAGAALGLHRFSFDLARPAELRDTGRKDFDNLGRMVARLSFNVSQEGYNGASGVAIARLQQEIYTKWRTDDSDVTSSVGVTMVQLGATAEVWPTNVATGVVCQNGGPDTMFLFRNWQGCTTPGSTPDPRHKGPLQTEHEFVLEVR